MRIILPVVIIICFEICEAQEKSIDRAYIAPAFGYASYIHVVEKPAPASDIFDNYAVYRYKLNYLVGGTFGFDAGRHTAVFANFATIYYKIRYWAKYGGYYRDWSKIENEVGDVFYLSIFIRYRFKEWNQSSFYCFTGPAVFSDDTELNPDYIFGFGILTGVGYGLKICNCLSINFESNYLGIFDRPSSVNFQIRPEFRL